MASTWKHHRNVLIAASDDVCGSPIRMHSPRKANSARRLGAVLLLIAVAICILVVSTSGYAPGYPAFATVSRQQYGPLSAVSLAAVGTKAGRVGRTSTLPVPSTLKGGINALLSEASSSLRGAAASETPTATPSTEPAPAESPAAVGPPAAVEKAEPQEPPQAPEPEVPVVVDLPCARNTAVHPAVHATASKKSPSAAAGASGEPKKPKWADDGSKTGPAPTDFMQFTALQEFSLHPLEYSPLRQPELDEGVPWRGANVQVRSSPAQSLSSQLPEGYVHATRDDEDVQRRAEWHNRCVGLPGKHGTAIEAAYGGHAAISIPELHTVQLDRTVLATHGFFVNTHIRSWLESVATGLYEPPRPYGFPPNSAPFYDGHMGWVEDHWIATFNRPVKTTMAWAEDMPEVVGVQYLDHGTGKPLPSGAKPTPFTDPATGETVVDVLAPYDAELFHPYVPLFIPWENMNAFLAKYDARTGTAGGSAKVCAFGMMLKEMLWPDAQYITVTQRPGGPWLMTRMDEPNKIGCSMAFMTALRNTLVLSAAGTGHVAIPLLSQPRPFLQCSADAGGARSHDLAFIGSNRPGARDEAMSKLQKSRMAMRSFVTSDETLGPRAVIGTVHGTALDSWGLTQQQAGIPVAQYSPAGNNYRHLWMRAMAGAAVQYAPRGNGPTSFRLYEALQMGLVPVYVHDGTPWLPYLKRGQSPTWVDGLPEEEQSLWARIAMVVDKAGLVPWLDDNASGPDVQSTAKSLKAAFVDDGARFKAMRLAGAAVRDRYFTYDGLLRRIAELVDDPDTAELDCQPSSFI